MYENNPSAPDALLVSAFTQSAALKSAQKKCPKVSVTFGHTRARLPKVPRTFEELKDRGHQSLGPPLAEPVSFRARETPVRAMVQKPPPLPLRIDCIRSSNTLSHAASLHNKGCTMKRNLLRHMLACALASAMTLGGATAAMFAAPTPAIAAPSGAIRPVQSSSSYQKITLEAGKTYLIEGDVSIRQYVVKGGTSAQPTRIYLSASNPVNDKRDERVETPMFALESGYIEIIGDTGSSSQAIVNCNGRVFLSDKTEESIYSYDYDAPVRSAQLNVKVSNLTITGNDNESSNVSAALIYGSALDGETIRFENATFCNWNTPNGYNSFSNGYEYYKNSPAPVTIRMTSQNKSSAPYVAFSGCTFRNNEGACAGALSVTSNSSLKPSVSLTGCTFNNNRQTSNFCAMHISGLESEHLHSGNIVLKHASATLSGCIMTSTKSMVYSPAAYMTYDPWERKYRDMPMTSEIAIGSDASCTLSGTSVSDTYTSGYSGEAEQDEKRYAILARGSLTLGGSTSVSTAKAGQVKLDGLNSGCHLNLLSTFSGRAAVTIDDSEFNNLPSTYAIGSCELTSEQLAQQVSSTNAGIALQTSDGSLYVNRLRHEHVWKLTRDTDSQYQMSVKCVGATRPDDCGYSGYTVDLGLASGTEKYGRVSVTYGTALTPRLTTSATGTGTLSQSIATITETRYYSISDWSDTEPQPIATPKDVGKYLVEVVVTSATGDTVILTRQFEITPLSLQNVRSLSFEYEGGTDTTVQGTTVRAYEWTGEEITPKFTISGYDNGWFTLEKGRDYTIETSKYSTPSATNPPDSSSYFPFYIIYVKGTGNYTGTMSTCWTISGTPLDVATVNGYEDEYDGQVHSVTASLPEGVTASYSVDGGTTWTSEAPSIKDVGAKTVDYKLEYGGETATGQVTLKVNPRAIKVHATRAEKTYGNADPELGWELLSGELADGEDLTDITVTREQGEAVREGNYTIMVSQAEGANPNYSITFLPGTFVINPRTLSVTWGTTEFTYDGAEHCPEATLGNVIGGDDLTATVEGAATEAGSSYEAAITGLLGADAGNYELPAEGLTCSFSIKKGEQGAPAVQAVAETIYGKHDGAITGLTTDMEWKRSDATSWTNVTENGEITGLAADSYDVRYAARANHDASPATTVTVKAGRMLTVTLPASPGCTVTTTASEIPWHGSTILSVSVNAGYFTADDFAVKINGRKIGPSPSGIIRVDSAEADVIVTVEGVLKHEADGSGWHTDSASHWRVCNCGEVIDKSEHTFEWQTVVAATTSSEGTRQQICTTCGYKGATEKIPALPASTDEKPTSPTTPSSPSNPSAPAAPTAPAAPAGNAAVEPALPQTSDTNPLLATACLGTVGLVVLAISAATRRR